MARGARLAVAALRVDDQLVGRAVDADALRVVPEPRRAGDGCGSGDPKPPRTFPEMDELDAAGEQDAPGARDPTAGADLPAGGTRARVAAVNTGSCVSA